MIIRSYVHFSKGEWQKPDMQSLGSANGKKECSMTEKNTGESGLVYGIRKSRQLPSRMHKDGKVEAHEFKDMAEQSAISMAWGTAGMCLLRWQVGMESLVPVGRNHAPV
jgi:hypothetical protein